jgi:hypothetical protein
MACERCSKQVTTVRHCSSVQSFSASSGIPCPSQISPISYCTACYIKTGSHSEALLFPRGNSHPSSTLKVIYTLPLRQTDLLPWCQAVDRQEDDFLVTTTNQGGR